MNLYSVLNYPWVYKLSQAILAPGRDRRVSSLLHDLLRDVDPGSKVLDVGCGPSSLLSWVGIQPIASDLSEPYMREYAQRSGLPAVVNSADALPFASQSFDSVWSFALIHHLPDDIAKKTLSGLVRVCKVEGFVIVVDAVMPLSPWARPLPYIIRKFDCGRFVRRELELR
jgi:ubiquinone/menaquinone biosynthesis C-methylase UbiE